MQMRTKTPGKAQQVVVPVKEKLSEHDLEQLKHTFDLFDEENSGTIDPTEIQKILQELGLDKRHEAVFHMVQQFQSKNRNINFDQFLEVVYNKLGDTKTKDGISKIFMLYDHDNAGTVDFEKIKRVARQLGETMNDEEILEMMHNTHILNQTEANQEFNFEEFYGIVTKKKY